MVENRASTSSCECPLCRQASVAARRRCVAMLYPRNLKTVWFLHSLAQLSLCRLRCTLRQSTPCCTHLVIPQLKISTVRELLVATFGGDKATQTPWPCSINVVDDILGLGQLLNSLLAMAAERGQQCLAWSIESKIPQTCWTWSRCKDEASNELVLLLCQYSLLSRYCLLKWRRYSPSCANLPGPFPRRRIMSRCLIQTESSICLQSEESKLL